MHLIWLAIAVVAAIASGAVGFDIGKNSAQIAAAIKSSAAAAGARPCPGATVPPAAGSHLASLLVRQPAGVTPLRGPFSHHVLSLGQFVSALYPQNPAYRSQLVDRCFQIAAQRGWTQPSGEIVAVYLIQFQTPADARSYALAAEAGDLADPLNRVHVAVSGVSDGILIEDPSLDKYGNTRTRLLGDQGNVAIIIHVFEPARLPSHAVSMSLLREQAARL